MKDIGKIKFFNKRFGLIKNEKNVYDFERKDISLDQKLEEGDEVIFRVEEKTPELKLARNITKTSGDKK